MRSKFFQKFNSDDRELNKLQSNVEDALTQTLKVPLLDGRLISKQTLGAGRNEILHKLGRPIVGYFVVSTSDPITYYDNLITGEDLNNSFAITSNGAAVISLWVF